MSENVSSLEFFTFPIILINIFSFCTRTWPYWYRVKVQIHFLSFCKICTVTVRVKNRHTLATDSVSLMNYSISDNIVEFTPATTPCSHCLVSHLHSTHTPTLPITTHDQMTSGPLVSCTSEQTSCLLLCDHWMFYPHNPVYVKRLVHVHSF